MSSTIGSIGASAPVAAAASHNSASPSRAQQFAALNQMLAKYRAGLSRGQSASMLSSLARQITTAAKALGQHVTLPKSPAGAAESSQPSAAAIAQTAIQAAQSGLTAPGTAKRAVNAVA